jgi:hypothetical protein
MGKPRQQSRPAKRRGRRRTLYDELGEYFRQVPGGIGDTSGGYTPGPWGLVEMEADQERAQQQFLDRLRRARLDQLGQRTQEQVQQDLQQRLQGRAGGGGGGGGTGWSGGGTAGYRQGGSFGGFRLSPIVGPSSGRRRGVVTITDLE